MLLKRLFMGLPPLVTFAPDGGGDPDNEEQPQSAGEDEGAPTGEEPAGDPAEPAGGDGGDAGGDEAEHGRLEGHDLDEARMERVMERALRRMARQTGRSAAPVEGVDRGRQAFAEVQRLAMAGDPNSQFNVIMAQEVKRELTNMRRDMELASLPPERRKIARKMLERGDASSVRVADLAAQAYLNRKNKKPNGDADAQQREIERQRKRIDEVARAQRRNTTKVNQRPVNFEEDKERTLKADKFRELPLSQRREIWRNQGKKGTPRIVHEAPKGR